MRLGAELIAAAPDPRDEELARDVIEIDIASAFALHESCLAPVAYSTLSVKCSS